MPITIKEFRQQYPQYDDMSDADLAKSFHDKYYSDMPFEDFAKSIGLTAQQPAQAQTTGTTQPASNGGFDAFKARLQSGQIKGVNSGTTMADMGAQFQKGLVQGAAGMAQFPEAAGTWLADKTFQGVDALLGREHKPTPRYSGGIPSPGEVGQMLVDATGVGEAKTVPGRYMNRFGQFLPSVVVGGPAGMAEKVLRAGTASVGAETAGHATKGMKILGYDLQPVAEFAGALLGNSLVDLGRRAVTPFPVNDERRRLLGVMDDEGVDLTAGQRTGNTGLKYAEAELGAGPAAQTMERQGEQFTAATLRRAGIDANRATPEVINGAFDRLGRQFDDLAAQTDIPLDTQLQDDLLNSVVDYQSMAGEVRPAAEQIINRISELANQNNGTLAGAAYQDIRSRISKILRSQGADPALKEVAGNIGNALDNAVERNLSGDLLDMWRTTRTQYRNLKTISKAATSPGAAEGLLPPSAVRSATLQQQGTDNFSRGRGDLTELARAGEATMRPLPQSGTAPRLMVQALGRGIPATVGTLLGSGAGLPGQFIGGLLGSTLAPIVEGQALMSRPVQRWLANQALRPSQVPGWQRGFNALLGVSAGQTAGGPR